MSKRLVMLLLAGTVLLAIVAAVPAAASAGVTYSASKPKLSAAPVMGVSFTASGVVRPKARPNSHTVVKIRLFMLMDGHYDVMHTYRAKLSKNAAGKLGTLYSRVITIPMDGKHAVRALHYRGGKLVAKSKVTYFDVQMPSMQITISDLMSHDDVIAPVGTPIDVVFPGADSGCAANIAFAADSGLTKTRSTPLTYHSDGLPAGRYDWKCSMMNCHYGTLVVQAPAEQIVISDLKSHADVTAPANTAIDVVFPDADSGCAANIAFADSGLTKTSSTPLRYHSDGLAPGRYDWKCSMMNCHYATLVVEAAAGARASAGSRGVTYSTSKPALSATPKMNVAFTTSGVIRPKSTAKSRATVKIVLWMKYGEGWGVMATYKAKLSKRPAGKPGTRYSRSITIPMKGDHGLQAVQYRGGKKVSSSAIKYFTVQP